MVTASGRSFTQQIKTEDTALHSRILTQLPQGNLCLETWRRRRRRRRRSDRMERERSIERLREKGGKFTRVVNQYWTLAHTPPYMLCINSWFHIHHSYHKLN